MGEAKNGALKLQFDGHFRLEFRGVKVTTDAGLLAVRELDEALKLTEMAGEIDECRWKAIAGQPSSDTVKTGFGLDAVKADDLARAVI